MIFPYEYPKDWVINQGRSWNEQYLVRAMLMFTCGFEVIFGCAYALDKYPELLRSFLNGDLYGGGSLWLRKIV